MGEASGKAPAERKRDSGPRSLTNRGALVKSARGFTIGGGFVCAKVRHAGSLRWRGGWNNEAAVLFDRYSRTLSFFDRKIVPQRPTVLLSYRIVAYVPLLDSLMKRRITNVRRNQTRKKST